MLNLQAKTDELSLNSKMSKIVLTKPDKIKQKPDLNETGKVLTKLYIKTHNCKNQMNREGDVYKRQVNNSNEKNH